MCQKRKKFNGKICMHELNDIGNKYSKETLDYYLADMKEEMLPLLNKHNPNYENAVIYIIKKLYLHIQKMDISIRRNKNIMMQYLEYDDEISLLGENLKKDPEVILKALNLRKDISLLTNANQKLLFERDFMLKAVEIAKPKFWLWVFLKDILKKDEEMTYIFLEKTDTLTADNMLMIFKEFNIKVNETSPLLIKFIEKNPKVMAHLDDKLKYNKEFLYSVDNIIMRSLAVPVDVFEAFKSYKREDMLNNKIDNSFKLKTNVKKKV